MSKFFSYLIGRDRLERINRFEALLIGLLIGVAVFVAAVRNPAITGG